MILVDTSVWIDHFRFRDDALVAALEDTKILSHPCVVGELALGHPKLTRRILSDLQALLSPEIASDAEVLNLILNRDLGGQGIGYVDAHLIASVLITPGCRLWTRDKRLLAAAAKLGVPLVPFA